jgi:hypothetical protein
MLEDLLPKRGVVMRRMRRRREAAAGRGFAEYLCAEIRQGDTPVGYAEVYAEHITARGIYLEGDRRAAPVTSARRPPE